MLHSVPVCSSANPADGTAQERKAAAVPRGNARGKCAAAMLAYGCCAMVAMTVLLSGCGLSPGMSFRAPAGVDEARNASEKTRTSGSIDPNDKPPPNALIEINPALIAKENAALPTTIPGDVEKLFGKPAPYKLGPGDVLSIVVWDHPEMNLPTTSTTSSGQDASTSQVVSGYTVDSAGMIQVAYVGPIHVAGLTELDARNLVASKLGYYLRNPQVTLRIEAYRSRRVYVDGEVRTPGLLVLNDMTMSLPEAINRAGGFTAAGDRSRVSVTRNKETTFVNIPDMIKKGVNPDNIILQNGDLVRVYSENDTKVYVMGEVGHAGGIPLNNGRMTLNEALGSAGGINQGSGDASQVYVVRGHEAGNRTVFHLDASSPEALATADQFELKPSDVVFVDASGLVKWSRVINLVLPSTQAAATGRVIGYGY